ncbi:NAD-binding protein [Flavobacterium sp. ZB4P13]|uniref:NAD-binding protein n=1 Tax=Flavobacterium sp. ZB4P13 TaxID=3401728 RepID=UPI003AAFAEBE
MNVHKVLLIGAGFMASEYLKVLKHLNCDVTVVSRSEGKINLLKKDFTDYSYYTEGLDDYLSKVNELPEFVINTVNVSSLRDVSLALLKAGVKNLLIEKPGDLFIDGLKELKNYAENISSNVYIAYNRRFYSSISELKKQVAIDDGITNCHFEFTEWIHTIDPSIYDNETLRKWIISNSSHVIDTVFHLIGFPKDLNTTVSGLDEIIWHPSGSVFTGSGVSEKNIPFSYNTDWSSAGRWSIEIFTKKRRFYLKPMEKLFEQKKGSINICEILLDDQLDITFKPGLLMQTQAFLNSDFFDFVSIDEQIKAIGIYEEIGGY